VAARRDQKKEFGRRLSDSPQKSEGARTARRDKKKELGRRLSGSPQRSEEGARTAVEWQPAEIRRSSDSG
jgi:hypothetical protein